MLKLRVTSSDFVRLKTETTAQLKLALPDVVWDDESLLALAKPYTFRVFLGNEYPHKTPLLRNSSQI